MLQRFQDKENKQRIIKIYNTGAHEVQEFKPLVDGKVSMYVCGPTVYAKPHLGNARPMIVFDVLYRLIIAMYGVENVRYVRNITDIDDKIINKARELDCTIYDVTSKALKEFEYIQRELNVLSPTDQPKATEYIERMCIIIKKLLEQGNAYINNIGDVLFSVDSFDGYDFFQERSNAQSGHRSIKKQDKRSEQDFILWKNVTDDDSAKYEFAWETPEYMIPEHMKVCGSVCACEVGCNNDKDLRCGTVCGHKMSGMVSEKPVKVLGRPGWHIECTAMSTALLGEKFDIHGGGADLISPHHQNERAQTCAYTCGDDCANYWMHNGMIQLDSGKMSKSLGNVLYLDEVCDGLAALSVRFHMLQTHYRHPLNWSYEQLKLAHVHFTNMIKNVYISLINVDVSKDIIEVSDGVLDALCNDLNTPMSISVIEQHFTKKEIGKAVFGMMMLGLLPVAVFDMSMNAGEIREACLKWLQRRELSSEQMMLLEERMECKQSKHYIRADELRAKLLEGGVQVDDIPGGYLWYVV